MPGRPSKAGGTDWLRSRTLNKERAVTRVFVTQFPAKPRWCNSHRRLELSFVEQRREIIAHAENKLIPGKCMELREWPELTS